MPFSLTYVAVLMLAAMGVENAEAVVDAVLTIAVAVAALYGRHRAGQLTWFGWRK